LASGTGTNVAAILAAYREGRLGGAEPRVIISNVGDAPVIERARGCGVATRVVAHDAFAGREQFEAALVAEVRSHDADHVMLAGFMRRLGPGFLQAFPGRVLNIPPSLLPSFPGLHAPRQALARGVKVSGCTVHLVDENIDGGPIIAQVAVPVLDQDSEETLAARILLEEHRLYPQVIRWLAEGRVRREGSRVFIPG
jgi:phosphoribosylglycinamide formyltransferase 1